MYNATQATKFATPDLILTALLHTAKGVLMPDLRCCTVAAEGVQRGRVFRDQPETFRVAATSRNVLCRATKASGQGVRTSRSRAL